MFEPTANARVMAAQTWDIYQAFMEVGFTEEQAMVMLNTIISSQIMANGKQGE